MARIRKNPFLIREVDEDLILDAYDLIYISREFVEQKLFSHLANEMNRKSMANVMLRRLRDDDYLAAVPLELNFIKSTLVYTLGKKGVEVVERLTGEEVVFDTRYIERAPTTIRHILEVGKFNVALKKAAEKTDFVEIRDWVSERRSAYQYSETKSDRIAPDAVILTLTRNHPFPFFLEWERSRQRSEITTKKFRQYAKYSGMKTYEEHPLVMEQIKPRIMVVCPDVMRVKAMMNTIKNIKIGMSGVIFGAKDEVLNDPLGQVWWGLNSADPEERYRPWELINYPKS